MALLPVYDWLGLELSRRQKLAINLLAIGIVIGALWSDFSTAVLRELPLVSRVIVATMGAAAVVVMLESLDHDLGDVVWVAAGAVSGFFVLDLLWIHPSVWENVPALLYWVAKPIWVGVPMVAVAWWLTRNTGLRTRTTLTIAGLVGIVVLQLYYTVVPIPTVDGASIQVGLVGNLIQGVPVHGAALLLALAIVVVGIRIRDS